MWNNPQVIAKIVRAHDFQPDAQATSAGMSNEEFEEMLDALTEAYSAPFMAKLNISLKDAGHLHRVITCRWNMHC